jgi:hypothetical protein
MSDWRAANLSVCDVIYSNVQEKLTFIAAHGSIEVCGNEQFVLGRDMKW